MAPEMKKETESRRVANNPNAPGITPEPEPAPVNHETEGDGQPSVEEAVTKFAAQDREEALVKEAVEAVNSIYRRNVDNGKLEIGGYLLDKVFAGKIEEAMSTNPYKSTTFKLIAENPALLVEAKTLGGWVRAAAVFREFDAEGLSFPQLTTYHLVELAKVKDKNRRAEIAKDADERDLTVKALRALIKAENGNGQSTPEMTKQDVEKTVKALGEFSVTEGFIELVGNIGAIKGMYTPGKALDFIPEVYASLENIQGAAQLLETLANSLDEIVNETRKHRSA